MNFVHIGDLHLDNIFTTIENRAEFGQERRMEQRKAMKEVIDFIKAKNVEYLFITGDFYENEYIRESTIKYVNDLFKEISKTKIYIAPGNHDPNIKNSFYQKYKWNDNVKIFTDKLEIINNDEVDIYGYGFNDFEMNKNQIESIIIENNKKINILVTHGTLIDGNQLEGIYNPISKNIIRELKFDYVAIGHIHKRDEWYPGSLISLGFDEPGEHGFIYGEIIDKQIKKEFIKIKQKEFCKLEVDISDISSKEELIEKINSLIIDNNYYEIVLKGYKKFETNVDLKLINKNVIKIKDNTKLKIELKENNNTLKGIFVKKTKKLLEDGKISEKDFEKILEIENIILEK